MFPSPVKSGSSQIRLATRQDQNVTHDVCVVDKPIRVAAGHHAIVGKGCWASPTRLEALDLSPWALMACLASLRLVSRGALRLQQLGYHLHGAPHRGVVLGEYPEDHQLPLT